MSRIRSDFKEAVAPFVLAAIILGLVALGHLFGVTYEEALYDERTINWEDTDYGQGRGIRE